MRVRCLFRLFAFAAVAGGLAACSLIAGLGGYSPGEAEVGPPPTSDSNDSNESSPGDESTLGRDAPEETETVPDGGDDVADEADADAQTDSAFAADADADAAEREASAADAAEAGPRPDASDARPPMDAPDDGCKPTMHDNGVGQTYTNCTPLDTYTAAEAASACAATGVGGCTQSGVTTPICPLGPVVECTHNAMYPCQCWAYTGAAAGHVNSTCSCPSSGDPQWH